MEVDYDVVVANDIDESVCTKDGESCYIVFICDDGNKYQVKFNMIDCLNNINELIGNYIATYIDAPVPKGNIISVPKLLMSEIYRFPKHTEIDPESIINRKFFGVQWFDDGNSSKTDIDLDRKLALSSNKNDFFATFPLDQYLRNKDRHIKNHLFSKQLSKNNKEKFYYAIDFDRIFGDCNLDSINEEKEIFECFSEDYHYELYKKVKDKDYEHIVKFAVNIDKIPDKLIKDLIELLEVIYEHSISNDELKEILNFLEARKNIFYQECLNLCHCFPNVKEKRLILK